MQEQRCDVLIVGGGGAALRAALEINEIDPHSKVILATKGELGKSGVTASACSDRMAFHVTLPFTEPGGKDNWRYHAEDIYRIGGYVSDEDLAQILAKNSQQVFEYLDSLGVPWVKKEGRLDQFVTDGSKYARACYTGPYTANHIEKVLLEKVKTTNVRILENFMVVDLIPSSTGDRVIGAFGLDRKEKPLLLKAKAIILATGGAGQAYKTNVYPEGMTGDGYAMAYRAGADLVNMEFIQIGLSSVETKLACSGSIMRVIPRFINDRGEEFMLRYFPSNTNLSHINLTIFQKGSSWPVSFEHASHKIDIAAYKELHHGRKVYLDYTCNPQGLVWEDLNQVVTWYKKVKDTHLSKEKKLAESPLLRLQRINPETIFWLKERGVNLPAGEKIEIAPAAQHFQGGVKIREKAQTSLKGLYAAGECAGAQHGANRPGGNALLDAQVFGKIAGASALQEACNCTLDEVDFASCRRVQNYIQELQNQSRGKPASFIRSRVQDILHQYASVMRTEQGLDKAKKELGKMRVEGIRTDKLGLVFAVETANILDIADMIVGAARLRQESRGPHLFFCHFTDADPVPRDDTKWRKYIVIRKDTKGMNFRIEDPRSRDL